MLALWLKARLQTIWWLCFLAASLPGSWLLAAYLGNTLGANPLETLTHTTGRTALVLLAVTLSVTPLRKLLASLSRLRGSPQGKRVSDWNWILRLRRMLGLWCFAYAAAHSWIFLEFDIGYEWPQVLTEVREKPFIAVGALALAILAPLAATSTQGMMRRLGRHWARLHTLIYLVAVLALLHFWWQVKPGVWRPLPDTLAIGGLLLYRLLSRLGKSAEGPALATQTKRRGDDIDSPNQVGDKAPVLR